MKSTVIIVWVGNIMTFHSKVKVLMVESLEHVHVQSGSRFVTITGSVPSWGKTCKQLGVLRLHLSKPL